MNKKGFILPLAVMVGSAVILAVFSYFYFVNQTENNSEKLNPEEAKDYLEVEEVLADPEAYLDKTIKVKGFIVRSQSYHSLVSEQAVKDGVIYGRDLLIEYSGSLGADYVNAGGTYKQTTVNPPNGVILEGVIKDKGEDSGNFRYYLEITDISNPVG